MGAAVVIVRAANQGAVLIVVIRAVSIRIVMMLNHCEGCGGGVFERVRVRARVVEGVRARVIEGVQTG